MKTVPVNSRRRSILNLLTPIRTLGTRFVLRQDRAATTYCHKGRVADITMVRALIVVNCSTIAGGAINDGKYVARRSTPPDIAYYSRMEGSAREGPHPLDSSFEVEAVVSKRNAVVVGGGHAAATTVVTIASSTSFGWK